MVTVRRFSHRRFPLRPSPRKNRRAIRLPSAAALLLAAAVSLALRPARGQEVSRQPPAGYEALAKLLTPLEVVAHPADPVAAGDKDGVVLLDEEVQSVDEFGRRLIIEHRIERALDEAGVPRVAESVHGYRKNESTIHLILARTVSPDGTAFPVRDDAALLHSPQDEAGESLYNDAGQLRVIFPNVKPLSVTESVVVIEEKTFRLPGEFAAEFIWAREWPRQKARCVVELPRALADRLQVVAQGSGVPAFTRESLDDGARVRFVWERDKIPGLTPEPRRAPSDQVGPITRLTTLADWGVFTRWYDGLLASRSTLSPALAAKVDAWTKDAPGPRETLGILFARVAADVRYTGLEFGIAALQPHDVCDVWDNQYGDCKDKANLLRAMLLHRGIPAYLTLLNTEHAGRIDRRSPGFSQFDHAIVAVELPGEHDLLFCDPTISRAVPGLLGPGDTNREVLVLQGDEPRWARTPAQDAGTLRYDLDLTLDKDGSLAGWITLEAGGFYGASYAERCARGGKEETRHILAEIVRGFYPSAEIVDTEQPTFEQGKNGRLRAYFVTPVPGSGGAARSLVFPSFEALLPALGDRSRRETPFFQWADRVVIDARFALPPGYAPEKPPAAYVLDSEAFGANARWEATDGRCRAALDLQTRQSIVPPEKFAAFYNGARSLRSWLEQPLLLAARDPAAAKPDEKKDDEAPTLAAADFPMMPSGDGQLELVDKRFPANGDPARRRAALERTRQYFPTDMATLFRVGVKLALLDSAAGRHAAAAVQIRALLRDDAAGLSVENATWGQYILAYVLKKADQPGEAQDIFARLARDPATPGERRAYAGWQAAMLLADKDPAEATQLLLLTLHEESDIAAQQFALLADLLLRQGRGAELDAPLRPFLASDSSQLDETVTALADTARDLLAGDRADQGRELIGLLEAAARGGDAAERMDKALAGVHSLVDLLAAARRLQQELREFLTRHPFADDDPARPREHTGTGRAELVREMDARESAGAPDGALRDALEVLTVLPPDGQFSHLLWRAAVFADWRERKDPHPGDREWLDELFAACDRLPASDDNRYEARFLHATRCTRLGDGDGALRLYTALRDEPGLPEAFRLALHVRLGKALEGKADLRGALAEYREIESEAASQSSADEALLRAAFIHLGFGERAEAFRLFDLLAKVPAATLEKVPAAKQLGAMVALTRDRAKAEAYWDAATRWLPVWRDILRENQPALLAEDDAIVPVIADLTALGQDLGKAARDKDLPRMLRQFRLLVHAARWQPEMTIEVADMALRGQGLLVPEFVRPARELAIAIGENVPPDGSEVFRKNQVLLTANFLDNNQADKAFAVAQAFRAREKIDDPIAQAMTRLWAVSAEGSGGELDEPIAAMERQLQTSKLDRADRPSAIGILSQLYRHKGRAADEEALLARELENPTIKSNPEASQRLATDLKELRDEHSGSAAFSQAVAHWMEAHRPAWYDLAEPRGLDDPRLGNVEEFLRKPPAGMSTAELAKGNLLIAGSDSQGLERKAEAWNIAVGHLLRLCLTRKESTALIDSVVAEAGMTPDQRAAVVFTATLDCADNLYDDEFEHWAHSPLALRFNERGRATVETSRKTRAACTDPDPGPALEAASRKLLGKPLGHWEMHALRRMFARCLQAGAFAEAERLTKAFATMDTTSDATQTRAAFQMETLKSLRQAQRLEPAIAELRRLTLERYPAEGIARPAILDDWRNPDDLEALPEEDARQIRRWQIKTRTWHATNLEFWVRFVRDLALSAHEPELARRLATAALQLTTTDQDRVEAYHMAESAVDTDDPAQRQWLTEATRPSRDPVKWPSTDADIRLREIRDALRLGQEIDLDAELRSVRASSWGRQYGAILRIRHFLQTRDVSALGNALDALSPDELLQGRWLWVVLPALECAGRADEADLARETARTELGRAVVRAWSEGDASQAETAYRLAQRLPSANGEKLLPANWLDECLARIGNRHDSLRLRMEDARRRRDWPALEKWSGEAIGAFPTMYDFYYDQAEALFMLGRKEEARRPLETYTHYSKNEQEYPQAMAWLHELGEAPAAR